MFASRLLLLRRPSAVRLAAAARLTPSVATHRAPVVAWAMQQPQQRFSYATTAKGKEEKEGQADSSSSSGKTQTGGGEAKQEDTSKKGDEAKKSTSSPKDGFLGGAAEDLLKSSANVRYSGFVPRHARLAMRQQREVAAEALRKKMEAEKVEANPDAGTGIVMHKDSAWKETWNKFKDNSGFAQRLADLQSRYEDSDNLFVHYMKRIQDSVTSIFAENEQAQTVKQIKHIDPYFDLDVFIKDMHEFIIPEFIEGYLGGDRKALKTWCSEGCYNVVTHKLDEIEKMEAVVQYKILDLRNVELAMAQLVDDKPILLVTCQAQQVLNLRDKSGKLIEGKEDDVTSVIYIFAMLKNSPAMQDPLTNGWKVTEFVSQGGNSVW